MLNVTQLLSGLRRSGFFLQKLCNISVYHDILIPFHLFCLCIMSYAFECHLIDCSVTMNATQCCMSPAGLEGDVDR